MKEVTNISRWLVVIGALLWGYEGITQSDLLGMVLGGSLENLVNIVIGAAGLVVGYDMVSGKKK